MNHKGVILAVALLALLAPAGLVLLSDNAAAAPYEGDYRIWGVSTPDSGALILAINENAKIVFPSVTWYIWLDTPTNVKLTTPNGEVVNESLAAGIHSFKDSYATGQASTIWVIGEDTITYTFTVASGAASAVEIDQPNLTITITKSQLDEDKRNLAIGCILCALAPSLFLIPYYKRKNNDDYYIPF